MSLTCPRLVVVVHCSIFLYLEFLPFMKECKIEIVLIHMILGCHRNASIRECLYFT